VRGSTVAVVPPNGSGRGDDHLASSPAQGAVITVQLFPPVDLHCAIALAAAAVRFEPSDQP
jgi:hypothetical protein